MIAENYVELFAYESRTGSHLVNNDELYDFLFNNDFNAWTCNAVRRLFSGRGLKDFIMQFHTGESTAEATGDWSWDARAKLGQTYLEKFAAVIWDYEVKSFFSEERTVHRRAMQKSVMLDGYKYSDRKLIPTEADILDTKEQSGVLELLYKKLQLANSKTAFHCLELSESHWLNSKWDDCISNARRFLECTLQEVASKHSQVVKSAPLDSNVFIHPYAVRDYLEKEGLIEKQEKSTIKEVYGMLSAKGSHPNIAAQDQARMLRQVALIFSHFVMLRLEPLV